MEAWQIVALLGCVIIVYTWIFRKKYAAPDQHPALLHDLEQVLDQHVEEIEASNQEVLDQLVQFKQEQQKERALWLDRLRRLEERIKVLEDGAAQHGDGLKPAAASKTGASTDIQAEAQAAESFQDRFRQLLELKERGLTTSQIVKETGMNPSEVRFILQLADAGGGEH
ncbi:hypothetical protein PRECH8_09970 [Insulibacter thermoxylanivorax]|uniref:Uncharacterized protein n=1 Tax=Insulibacter thermoxylanivorax TaxID=2749268 RepID=A0A916VFR2_9BACL|nr:hypothetical protein [Insulibacter thermoxylanivorax]GFR37701.1 hypothetical protein PRECH8_09970 [Insulibacter thermoxylanivorax]